MTPRRGLFTDTSPSPDVVLAQFEGMLAEFPRPPGLRSRVECDLLRRIQYQCRLSGLADAGAVETHSELVRQALDLGWTPAGEPAERTSETSSSWTQEFRRDALGLTIAAERTRGLLGSSYSMTLVQLEGAGSMPRRAETLEEVRIAWREVTANVEGYHFENCNYIQDLYQCGSAVPLVTIHAATFDAVAESLVRTGWVPTTELPVGGSGYPFQWSFLRGGLLCTVNIAYRTSPDPLFVHTTVVRLPG